MQTKLAPSVHNHGVYFKWNLMSLNKADRYLSANVRVQNIQLQLPRFSQCCLLHLLLPAAAHTKKKYSCLLNYLYINISQFHNTACVCMRKLLFNVRCYKGYRRFDMKLLDCVVMWLSFLIFFFFFYNDIFSN